MVGTMALCAGIVVEMADFGKFSGDYVVDSTIVNVGLVLILRRRSL
ncbi:MAG: hypothetical protein KF874_13435 [Rhizobiaceae bacterium]|nr:hypothetical protein [Rhizobiaceae bacterium]